MSNRPDFLPYAGAFVIGSVIGALAGVLAGLLLAPKSGMETQAELRRRAEDIRGQADDVLVRSREKLRTSLDSGGKFVESAKTRLAEGMEQAASSISERARNIRPDSKSTAG
jgi:gas vesicle protein